MYNSPRHISFSIEMFTRIMLFYSSINIIGHTNITFLRGSTFQNVYCEHVSMVSYPPRLA